MNSDSDNALLRNASSRIPTPVSTFRRSASIRLRGKKANLSTSLPLSASIDEDGDYSNPNFWKGKFVSENFNKSRIGHLNRDYFDDDLESVGSVVSNFSNITTNSSCEHAHFAKNGTTYSGRSHKYIVHCSGNVFDQEEYLTPTQRANRSIKKLKSLLQLAREKLREKEEEIFKLNKEVVELKLAKTEEAADISEKNPTETVDGKSKDLSFDAGIPHNLLNFSNETCNEASPIKSNGEDSHNFAKISPIPASECWREKMMATPDYLISSMGDSGNFDDLPSSASVYSKDSISFMNTPEMKHFQEESLSALNDFSGGKEEDKMKIITTYEKKLEEKKLEYEMELNRVVKEQEEKNISMLHEFEKKLKEEEAKFEMRWNELLKDTEEEKILIVNRFEEKLEEERKKFKESLKNCKLSEQKVTDMVYGSTYSEKVEEEKTIYETSLMDIKQKFESEKSIMEEKFDNAMKAERMKFEESLKAIKEISDSKIVDLTEKISKLETEYSELLPKYEEILSKGEELEKENQRLRETIKQQEESHKKIYVELFKKGQEAAKLEFDHQDVDSTSKRMSVPELFAQLKITEAELENLKDKEYRAQHTKSDGLCLLSSKEAISLWILAARKAMYKRLAEAQAKSAQKEKEKSEHDPEATLQFLKSAVYYFLTDRENHLGHLKAIESILAFSSTEKSNIEKLYLNKY